MNTGGLQEKKKRISSIFVWWVQVCFICIIPVHSCSKIIQYKTTQKVKKNRLIFLTVTVSNSWTYCRRIQKVQPKGGRWTPRDACFSHMLHSNSTTWKNKQTQTCGSRSVHLLKTVTFVVENILQGCGVMQWNVRQTLDSTRVKRDPTCGCRAVERVRSEFNKKKRQFLTDFE